MDGHAEKLKCRLCILFEERKNVWKYIPYQGQILTLVKMRVTAPAPAPAQSPIICSLKIW